jgi:hypothetical protein
VDFEQSRCICGGFSAFGHHLSDLCLLLGRKLWTPTTNPAFLAGSIQSRFGSFLEHGLFKLSEGPDHLHHHSTRGCSRVNRLRQTAKSRTGFPETLHDG